MLDVMRLRGEIAKPYLAPPGLPPDRLEALRAAFLATTKDPGFLTDVASEHLEYDTQLSGAELAAQVEQVSRTPRSTIDRLVELLSAFNEGEVGP